MSSHLALAVGTLGNAAIALANPSDPAYRLVFADEFNGTSLDTSKWSAASPSWTMPNSLSTASANEVSVNGGLLTMNAVRTGATTWSSGSVSTYNKYNFAGGYVEARIQLPSTPGSWPAFWGLYDGWPPEADIMEYPLSATPGSGYANDTYHTAFHYTNANGAAAAGAGSVDTNVDLRGTWHTFAMDWTSGTSVRFLLDGVQKTSFNSSSVGQMANMYMILDYAVGGWPGTPSTSQWAIGDSDQTRVDWVRVWQKNANNDASSTWNVNGNGAFNTAANWTGAGVPKFGNQVAVFGRVGTAATAAISMPSWSVFGGMTFDGLTSGATAGTTAYTIGSNASLIQLASTASGGPVVRATASSTVSQNVNARVELWNNSRFQNDMTGGTTLNFNSEISGAGSLTATGVGATVLNTANSYSGGTILGSAAGPAVLRAAASGALGSGPVTFDPTGNGSTARLDLTGGITLPNNISLAGRTNSSVAIQSLAGNNTLAGTITAGTGGNTYLIQSDAGTLTLSGAAAVASAAGVALQAGTGARTFTLQGNGDGVVSGRIQNGGGTVSLAKAGPGTWTATAANTFTGSVAVTGGKLLLAHGGTTSGITVGSGATLGARGAIITSGLLASSGTLDLVDAGIATVSAGTLNLTGSALNLQLGDAGAADRVAASGLATVSGTNTINFYVAPGQSIAGGSAYTLVTANGGLNAANFAVGSRPASLGFYDFTLSTPNSSALLVNVTGNPAPATAYWTGAGSLAIGESANNWGAGASVSTSNWATDAAGANDARQLPGSITSVIFNAANVAGSGAYTTRLDSDYAINGLTFDVTHPGLTSAQLQLNGNALSIGTGGLTLAATSQTPAGITGSGAVQLNGSQNWANNSSQALTVSSPVNAATDSTLLLTGTGTGGVTLSGPLSDGAGVLSTVFDQAGVTTLSAANSYTGATTISSGIVTLSATGRLASDVQINGGTLRLGGGTDNLADAANVTVNTAGTLDLAHAIPGAAKTETIAALAGSGIVTRSNGGLSTLTVGSADASSTFSGSIQNGAGTVALVKTGAGTVTLSGANSYTGGTTITDAGGKLRITHAAALGSGPLTIGNGGSEPSGTLQLAGDIAVTNVPTIHLSSRSTLSNGGAATIENLSGINSLASNLNINAPGGSAANIVVTAGQLTLSGNLGSTGLSSARGFDFGGEGTGVVTGVISNGTAQPTFVQKDNAGTWTLAGNNTYTGGTTVNGGTLHVTGVNNWGIGSLVVIDGTVRLAASNTYTGGTTINGQAVGGSGGATGGRVVMNHPTALGTGGIAMGGNATLEVATDGGDRAYNINVGTNNTINLVSSVKTGTTGINHTLGALSIGNSVLLNVTAGPTINGGNPAITLGAVTLSSGFGAGSTTFNPTTASLKLGAISTSTGGAKTVILDGTASGNAVNGPISNGSAAVAVLKSNSSTWALTAAGSYSGGTIIADNGGKLLVTHGAALGSGALTIGQGGSNPTGWLQLSGGINITGLAALNAAGRNAVNAGGTPTIENVGGANTISTPVTFNSVGGNFVNLVSTAGTLNLTGALTAANVTGSRGFSLDGSGDGTISGAISNGSANVFLTKSGIGTWSLTGSNSYAGVTAVAGGTLRATPPAYGNFLSNAGGVDLTGAQAWLMLDYTAASPAGTIDSLLSAAAASNFAAGQIRSSTLPADMTIGFADNEAGRVSLRLTYAGDADLNGQVDFNDFLVLQNHFGQSGTRFDQGDFNYDGLTDFNDFLALQNHFGQSVSGAAVDFSAAEVAAIRSFANSVPEPACLAVLGVSAVAVLRRRARRVES